MEVILGGVIGYGAFTNSGYDWESRMSERIGAVISTDFIREYVSDYTTGQALQYLV